MDKKVIEHFIALMECFNSDGKYVEIVIKMISEYNGISVKDATKVFAEMTDDLETLEAQL